MRWMPKSPCLLAAPALQAVSQKRPRAWKVPGGWDLGVALRCPSTWCNTRAPLLFFPREGMQLPASELYFNILQVVCYGSELLKFIMSKAFLRRKVPSTKVTDWVDPSFDDFSENTSIPAITATSFSVNNPSHRRKNVPSTLESSSFPSRKRATLSSSEQIYALENSKNYLSENEPWVDKYKPETQHELAVHKKKIEEVETWLKAEVLERQTKQSLAHLQSLHWVRKLLNIFTFVWDDSCILKCVDSTARSLVWSSS
ncbi:cell cycle checkpoint protein RAD17-like [Artibeus jamaicensis]|uniref:cell cycle checkpoint protein RAD17-like n=1 Tax=Artibeus jamaicensis TaxID=9417 RepID=UPI00235AF758|nr:cell cycle checkpoint protein RAD17-like [Artibeus jamaicensis]